MVEDRERGVLEADARLRALLEPRSDQVERVARKALRPRPTHHGRWLPAAVAGAAGVLAVVGVLLAPPSRLHESLSPDTASRKYSLSNRDGVMVVRRPDGATAFLHAPEQPLVRPRGMMMIVRGETEP